MPGSRRAGQLIGGDAVGWTCARATAQARRRSAGRSAAGVDTFEDRVHHGAELRPRSAGRCIGDGAAETGRDRRRLPEVAVIGRAGQGAGRLVVLPCWLGLAAHRRTVASRHARLRSARSRRSAATARSSSRSKTRTLQPRCGSWSAATPRSPAESSVSKPKPGPSSRLVNGITLSG